MYIEDDLVNENMVYETISSDDEMIFEDEIENKNEIDIKNNAINTENTVGSFKINQNPKNIVEIIHIQPLHSRERLKRKQKTIIRKENNKKQKTEYADNDNVEITDFRYLHPSERLCLYNKQRTKKEEEKEEKNNVQITDIIPLHLRETLRRYNKEKIKLRGILKIEQKIK